MARKPRKCTDPRHSTPCKYDNCQACQEKCAPPANGVMEGWGMNLGSKVHHYFRGGLSACGKVVSFGKPMMAKWTTRKCKACEEAVKKLTEGQRLTKIL